MTFPSLLASDPSPTCQIWTWSVECFLGYKVGRSLAHVQIYLRNVCDLPETFTGSDSAQHWKPLAHWMPHSKDRCRLHWRALPLTAAYMYGRFVCRAVLVRTLASHSLIIKSQKCMNTEWRFSSCRWLECIWNIHASHYISPVRYRYSGQSYKILDICWIISATSPLGSGSPSASSNIPIADNTDQPNKRQGIQCIAMYYYSCIRKYRYIQW